MLEGGGGGGADRMEDIKERRSVGLSPPKSLQGTENVDTVWEIMTKRFPNVAPLLCEMESVIERTQDLLRRLRVSYPAGTPLDESTTSPKREASPSLEDNVGDRIGEDRIRAKNKEKEESQSDHEVRLDRPRSEENNDQAGKSNLDEHNLKNELDPGDIKEEKLEVMLIPRDPLTILEEYANRSNVTLHLQCTPKPLKLSKTRRYIVDGQLAHYKASAFGDSVERAKNNFATKILRQVTFDQMWNESIAPLLHLSRQEMLEVMNLEKENKGTTETALTRLYRICLEKEEPLPVFNYQRLTTYEGLCLNATCTALGYTGCGKAVNKSIATKMAAEKTYEQYCRGSIVEAVDPS